MSLVHAGNQNKDVHMSECRNNLMLFSVIYIVDLKFGTGLQLNEQQYIYHIKKTISKKIEQSSKTGHW